MSSSKDKPSDEALVEQILKDVYIYYLEPLEKEFHERHIDDIIGGNNFNNCINECGFKHILASHARRLLSEKNLRGELGIGRSLNDSGLDTSTEEQLDFDITSEEFESTPKKRAPQPRQESSVQTESPTSKLDDKAGYIDVLIQTSKFKIILELKCWNPKFISTHSCKNTFKKEILDVRNWSFNNKKIEKKEIRKKREECVKQLNKETIAELWNFNHFQYKGKSKSVNNKYKDRSVNDKYKDRSVNDKYKDRSGYDKKSIKEKIYKGWNQVAKYQFPKSEDSDDETESIPTKRYLVVQMGVSIYFAKVDRELKSEEELKPKDLKSVKQLVQDDDQYIDAVLDKKIDNLSLSPSSRSMSPRSLGQEFNQKDNSSQDDIF